MITLSLFSRVFQLRPTIMSKAIYLILFCALKIVSVQKCSYIFEDKNVFKLVRCKNLNSMVDVAGEIQSNWTSIEVLNDSNHTQFSNVAVNVPYLNVIQSFDLARAGKVMLTDTGFRDYDVLRVLDISQSYIEALKPSWFSKKTIENLNLSENFLKSLKKDDMKFLSRLKIFNASFNEIKTVELNAFLEAKKLETISLSHNQLINVVFDNLENLKSLYLKGNQIVTVWAYSFTKLPRLETLNLADNAITGIVDRSFSSLESLKYLNLSHNKIPYAGPWTYAGCSKTKLEELDMSYNLIVIIYPVSLHELTLLKFLDVSNNKITEIFEKNFFKSTSLQTLLICHNKIKKIPPKSFEKLMMLKTMDISDNKLESFTAEMFGGNLFVGNKLKKLNLSKNLLTTLSADLFKLLLSLATLDVSENQIKTLSAESLKSNVNLQTLQLGSNLIEFISAKFFEPLKSLQVLDFENNRFSYLPVINGPKKLMKLSIGKNPWQCICLRETIIWARTNNILLDDVNFILPLPSCVVLPETSCIKDEVIIESYQIFDKFMDGLSSEDNKLELE